MSSKHQEVSIQSNQLSLVLTNFSNFQIDRILLDSIINTPSKYTKALLYKYELKSYANIKQMITQGDFINVYKLGESLGNRFVWKMIANAAMKAKQFDISKKCFARCNIYSGIRFINSVVLLDVIRFDAS